MTARNPWAFARDNGISVCVTSETIELATDGTAGRITVRWSPDTDRTHSLIWTGLARCLLQRQQGLYTETQAAALAAEIRGAA